MAAVVAGIYEQGVIKLLETPAGVREGPVRVILMEANGDKAAPRPLQFGKYQGGRLSTLEDFRGAEWRGNADFDDQ